MRDFDLFAAQDAFRAAMVAAGIVPPEHLEADGRIHRCDVEGKRGKKDAAYLLHLDGVPAGGFQDWHGGEWCDWCFVEAADLTPGEWQAQRDLVKAIAAQREIEAQKRRQEARDEAERIWDDAKPCMQHPYLERKGVQPHGLRVTEGKLVVPMRDDAGVIQSIQFIDDAGGKKFLPGGTVKGNRYTIGKPGEVICIAEGFATAASIREATDYAVVVAFDCGNLLPVADAIRAKLPTAKIVICADDDYLTEKNPGVTKAHAAAKAIGGLVAVPEFNADRPEKATDFNDLAQAQGPTSVAFCIEKSLASDTGPIAAKDLFPLVYREIEDRKAGKSKTTIKTGISSVDRFTGGLRRGYLTVIAGLPGQGKTAAAAGILVHNVTNGIPALLFSIEMDRLDIGIRLVSMESGITASDLFSDERALDKREFGRLMESCERLGNFPLTIDDRPVNATQIEDQAHLWYSRAVKATGAEVGVIAIDYLGLIKSEEGNENRNREVAALVQRVKLLARTLRAPVILLAQLNREAAKRGGHPQPSDLRDSGEIEAAADAIIFPFPAERHEDGGKVLAKNDKGEWVKPDDLWIVAKNKNGRKGAVALNWNPLTMHYTAIADEPDGPPRDTAANWQDGADQ